MVNDKKLPECCVYNTACFDPLENFLTEIESVSVPEEEEKGNLTAEECLYTGLISDPKEPNARKKGCEVLLGKTPTKDDIFRKFYAYSNYDGKIEKGKDSFYCKEYDLNCDGEINFYEFLEGDVPPFLFGMTIYQKKEMVKDLAAAEKLIQNNSFYKEHPEWRADMILMAKNIGNHAEFWFRSVLPEMHEEFENPARRADLIKMAEMSGEDTQCLFQYVYPEIRDKFIAEGYEGISDYWGSAVKIGKSAGPKINFLFGERGGFLEIREEFKDPAMRADLVKMAQAAKEEAYFLFGNGFPEIREEFKDPAMRADLVKMAEATGKNAGTLFLHGFPEIREDFKDPAKRADLVKMTEVAGENAAYLFQYLYPSIRDKFMSGGYEKIYSEWQYFTKLAETIGERGIRIFFEYAFSELREEFNDPAMKADFMKIMRAAGKQAGHLLEYGLLSRLEEMKNPAKRAVLLRMVEDTGEYAGDLLEYITPYVKLNLDAKEYEKMRGFWIDCIQLIQIVDEIPTVNMRDLLNSGFPILFEFQDPEMRADLIKISRATGKGIISFFSEGFPKIREDFKNPVKRVLLIKMIKMAGEHAGDLFRLFYPDIRNEFESGEYKKVMDYWTDVVTLVNLTKIEPYYLYEYVFSNSHKEIKDLNLRTDLVKMAKMAGEYAGDLFRNTYRENRDKFLAGGYESIRYEWESAIREAKENKATTR